MLAFVNWWDDPTVRGAFYTLVVLAVIVVGVWLVYEYIQHRRLRVVNWDALKKQSDDASVARRFFFTDLGIGTLPKTAPTVTAPTVTVAPAEGAAAKVDASKSAPVQVAATQTSVPPFTFMDLLEFDSLLCAGYDDAAYYHLSRREFDTLVKRKIAQGYADAEQYIRADCARVNAGPIPPGYAGSRAEQLRERATP